jgi:hypothetical protein
VTKRMLPALLALPLLGVLAVPVGQAAASPANVYAAPPTFVPGFESSMAFTPTADPTLLAQLDNQQGSDADSTTYSQAFQVAADGAVDTISWWGTGSSQTGFMVALHDGVWGNTTSLPNGPVVEGVLAQLSVVPIAQVTRTPASNGETRYSITVPATRVFASHAYRLSVTAVGGSFEWDESAAPGCCTGTTAVNWVRGRLQSYLSQPNVSFSLDDSGTTVVGMSVVPAALPVAVHGTAYVAPALAAVGGNGPYTWKLAPGSAHLPKGLRLARTTGVIAGTPKVAGVYTFTVQASDTRTTTRPRTQNKATGTFTIVVA